MGFEVHEVVLGGNEVDGPGPGDGVDGTFPQTLGQLLRSFLVHVHPLWDTLREGRREGGEEGGGEGGMEGGKTFFRGLLAQSIKV